MAGPDSFAGPSHRRFCRAACAAATTANSPGPYGVAARSAWTTCFARCGRWTGPIGPPHYVGAGKKAQPAATAGHRERHEQTAPACAATQNRSRQEQSGPALALRDQESRRDRKTGQIGQREDEGKQLTARRPLKAVLCGYYPPKEESHVSRPCPQCHEARDDSRYHLGGHSCPLRNCSA